jgi:hypothetical protein
VNVYGFITAVLLATAHGVTFSHTARTNVPVYGACRINVDLVWLFVHPEVNAVAFGNLALVVPCAKKSKMNELTVEPVTVNFICSPPRRGTLQKYRGYCVPFMVDITANDTQ